MSVKKSTNLTLNLKLLTDIYIISDLLLKNISSDIIICLGQSPAYFGIGMMELNRLMNLQKKIYNVPLSGVSSLEPFITQKHYDDYCVVLDKIFNNFEGVDIKNGTNITIIDFAIRGNTINIFVKLLQHYTNSIKLFPIQVNISPNFINIIDTYRYTGLVGPEIKDITGKIRMISGVCRPNFRHYLKLKYVKVIGYIVSDQMEYFCFDGVPRIIPEFKYFMWAKPNVYLQLDNKIFIKKTKFFINIIYQSKKIHLLETYNMNHTTYKSI